MNPTAFKNIFIEDYIYKVTWVTRLFSPTSPHRTCGVHYCPVKRRIPRKEYWRCRSQTEGRKETEKNKIKLKSYKKKKLHFKQRFTTRSQKQLTSFRFVVHRCVAVHPGLHTGSLCTPTRSPSNMPYYLQQSEPLLVVKPLHSSPEPADHYVVVVIT